MYEEPRRDPWLLDPWCMFFFTLIIVGVTLGLSYMLDQVLLVRVEEVEITPVELDYIVALPLVTVAFFVGFLFGIIVGKRSKKEKEASKGEGR